MTLESSVHRRRWAILAVLCLSLILVVVNNTIVNVALPTISRELSASTRQLQWIVDAYVLVFCSLLLAMGHFGDRNGRRRALRLGLVLFALFSALASRATSPGQLIAASGLMGIGAALVFPATLAILVSVFRDRRERATAIGIWTACTGLAVALGPITGGLLLEHFWWGSVYLVNVPVALTALAAGWFLIPDSRDPEEGRLDLVGLALSMSGIALLVYSIIEAPRNGWTSSGFILEVVTAVVLLVAFAVWEIRSSHPLLDVRLFRRARFTAASLAVTTAFFALFGFIFLITQYLQLVQGYTPLQAGIRTLPFAVTTGIASPLGIALMHRFGTTIIVSSGLLLMSTGFVLASRLQVDTPWAGLTVISMIVVAAGLGLTTSPATESIMGALPPDKAGVGSAVNDTTRELGGTLGVAVIGSVFASVFATRLAELLEAMKVPASVIDTATSSMTAALIVAQRSGPDGAAIADAARSAFVDGLSRGSLVAAGVALAGAVLAALLLPARHHPHHDADVDAVSSETGKVLT
jgi:EmrB/QacA subfamily drug resistance transporter